MIVSHKEKFIFLKTRKTAGTSIEVALTDFCGDSDIITPTIEEKKDKIIIRERKPQNYKVNILSLRGDAVARLKSDLKKAFIDLDILGFLGLLVFPQKYWQHTNASYLKERLGEQVWNDYFKISVERHPYEKVLSQYWFHVTVKGYQYKDFDDYLSRIKYRPNLVSDWEIYSPNGSPEVDYFIIHPDLDAGLKGLGQYFKKEIKIPEKKFKSGLRRGFPSYVSELNPAQKKIIQEVFHKEFNYFNFPT